MRLRSEEAPALKDTDQRNRVDKIQRGDEIDLRWLIAALWTGKWWIATSAALCAILLGLVAVVSTPVYRATVVLVSADSNTGVAGDLGGGSLGGLAALAGLDLGSRGLRVAEALAVLQSREFIETFVRDRNLLPVLFEKQWEQKGGTWIDPDNPPTFASAYKYFLHNVLSVAKDTESGLITMNVDWKDRNVATDWANDLVARLNSEMRSRAADKADASIRFLEAEMKGTSMVQTQEAISRLMEMQINQRMLANVTQEYSLRVVDRAMPPDEDDPVRPKKLLMVAAGLMLGAVIGALAVLAMSALKWMKGSGRQPLSA